MVKIPAERPVPAPEPNEEKKNEKVDDYTVTL